MPVAAAAISGGGPSSHPRGEGEGQEEVVVESEMPEVTQSQELLKILLAKQVEMEPMRG